MIKILCKNGTFKQKVKGFTPIIMREITITLSRFIHNEKTDKSYEKVMGFAAMLGMAQVFTKSEMLELLHDACEGKDPDSMIFEYFEKVLTSRSERAILRAEELCAIADAMVAYNKNLNKGPEKKPDLMC